LIVEWSIEASLDDFDNYENTYAANIAQYCRTPTTIANSTGKGTSATGSDGDIDRIQQRATDWQRIRQMGRHVMSFAIYIISVSRSASVLKST
jgi:hypothetical protein